MNKQQELYVLFWGIAMLVPTLVAVGIWFELHRLVGVLRFHSPRNDGRMGPSTEVAHQDEAP